MFIYGVSARTGNAFKGDYVVIDFQTFSIKGDSSLPKVVEILGWGPVLRKSNNVNVTYTTDMLLSNNAIMEVYFYLDHPQAPQGVKFGFTIRRNASLPDSEQPLLWPADTGATFILATSFTLRQQHSGLEPLYCDVPPPSFSAFANCRSDVFTEGITYVRYLRFRLLARFGLPGARCRSMTMGGVSTVSVRHDRSIELTSGLRIRLAMKVTERSQPLMERTLINGAPVSAPPTSWAGSKTLPRSLSMPESLDLPSSRFSLRRSPSRTFPPFWITIQTSASPCYLIPRKESLQRLLLK
jgi:hypothetical protein